MTQIFNIFREKIGISILFIIVEKGKIENWVEKKTTIKHMELVVCIKQFFSYFLLSSV